MEADISNFIHKKTEAEHHTKKKQSNRIACRRWISCILIPIMILFTLSPCFASETVSATARSKFYDLKSEILVNPFKYSGYYKDPESQMYYLNARYYSPELMRFISKDTYDLSNRYAYCEGNPISSIDPSGHMSKAVGMAINFGASTIAGLAVGALLPPATGIASAAVYGALAGAAAAAAGETVQQGIEKGSVNIGNVGIQAGIGAVTGAVGAAGAAFGKVLSKKAVIIGKKINLLRTNFSTYNKDDIANAAMTLCLSGEAGINRTISEVEARALWLASPGACCQHATIFSAAQKNTSNIGLLARCTKANIEDARGWSFPLGKKSSRLLPMFKGLKKLSDIPEGYTVSDLVSRASRDYIVQVENHLMYYNHESQSLSAWFTLGKRRIMLKELSATLQGPAVGSRNIKNIYGFSRRI